MENLSVNGQLEPTGDLVITDQYNGHFLKVSYTRKISGRAVFSKDRVNVEGNGEFRFFIPKEDLLENEIVTIEAFAPDGEMLGRQVYSYGSLHASPSSVSANDDSEKLEISLDPKIIKFNVTSPEETVVKKVNGKVIDLSGEKKVAGLQVIIMVSEEAEIEFDSGKFKAIFSAVTGKNGYFFGKTENKKYKQAFGIIAGNKDRPVMISLDEEKIPREILLVTDLSELPEELGCGCKESTPSLPDSEDLVNSTSFSQDIGGQCIDFTVPNRTLEEFSFYHTVRTTEPEIKGLTITSSESKKIKNDLLDLSGNIFTIFGRLNNSFSSLSLLNYSLEPEETIKEAPEIRRSSTTNVASAETPVPDSGLPNYMFKLQVGAANSFKINVNALAGLNKKVNYLDIIQLAKEQAQKRKKLQELQQKLAAAYCGKKGIQEAKSYCENLALQDQLDRDEMRSLLAGAGESSAEIRMDAELKKQVTSTFFELQKLVEKQSLDTDSLRSSGKRLHEVIKLVEEKTEDSPQQDYFTSQIRSMILTLEKAAEESGLHFEPCPPAARTETMGIMCLIQKFNDIKETLQNTVIFSLGEILEIKSYYTIFLESISSFMNLLDEFYTFYTSGTKFATELVDDYFFINYEEIKSTLSSLKREIYRASNKVEEIERAYILNHPGRVYLTVETSVDWDETPTIYENTTIANGHILHFKQQWKADGYSLGDLLYSLPLAPCQEKQIAIIDWDRKEQGLRTETQVVSEEMEAQISRDRDISEIMNSSFNESIAASSTNSTSSTSAGIGGGIGGFISPVVFGVAGGISHSGASSTSTANQDSSRNIAGNSLNRLRDNTSQSASSLRNQRNTVIQAVGQNETVNVQTEVIKNNNHCHAMTVEYFEVLKHYAVEQNLVDVQECLFVPLPMSLFDNKKVLRWRNTLQKAVYGRKLRLGFDAIERIESSYVNSDLPTGSYADEAIEEFSGHFTITFELERPYIREINEATKTEEYDLSLSFPWFFGRIIFPMEREVPLTEQEKDAVFEEQYAPDIVRKFIDTLQVYAIADNGDENSLNLDFTLLSNYKKGSALKVSIAAGDIQNITRKGIKHLRFRAATNVKPSSKIILRSVYLHYRTRHLSEYIIRNGNVNNDIINSSLFLGIQVTDAALLYTPLNYNELRNPRKEDQDAALALKNFLNEYLEMSHKIIWSAMDPSRLFGLLDGYIAPGSGGRSVASVVENKVLGIVGNNLVLKVIPGERLDPVFKGVENLMDYYQPTTKPDPYRISVPTKGVYAESVMGKCNSCEEIDETRHWRFSQEPCGSHPTAIEPISTASRRSEPGNLQVKDLPSSIINMQNAPAAPDVTGLAAAYGLLGQSDAFKDLTGLSGTQANALGALKTTSQSVTDLANISKDFANLAVLANQKTDGAKQIEQIKKLNKEGYLSEEDTSDQIKKVLESYNNAAKSLTKKQEEGKDSVAKKISEKAVAAGMNSPEQDIEYQKKSADGETETIKVTKPVSKKDDNPLPVILLTGQTSSPELRAFNPSRNDKSLSIEVEATFNNAPEGSRIRWSSPNPQALQILTPMEKKTKVRGIVPGIQDLDVELLDTGGNRIASSKLKLSVPQIVRVIEESAEFKAALESFELFDHKNDLISELKTTVEHLLRTANVRVIWQLGNLAESVPAHVPANMVITATIKNTSAGGELGSTSSATADDTFNESILLYPGMYATNDAIDVDTETIAIIQKLSSNLETDEELIPIAIKVYGRLIGETLSHEIGHALLWDDIPQDGHNSPPIPNDIMNSGVNRLFRQRTGMENTSQTSPVEPEDYVDHGLNAIGGFQFQNQRLLDNQYPVPPAHG